MKIWPRNLYKKAFATNLHNYVNDYEDEHFPVTLTIRFIVEATDRRVRRNAEVYALTFIENERSLSSFVTDTTLF